MMPYAVYLAMTRPLPVQGWTAIRGYAITLEEPLALWPALSIVPGNPGPPSPFGYGGEP